MQAGTEHSGKGEGTPAVNPAVLISRKMIAGSRAKRAAAENQWKAHEDGVRVMASKLADLAPAMQEPTRVAALAADFIAQQKTTGRRPEESVQTASQAPGKMEVGKSTTLSNVFATLGSKAAKKFPGLAGLDTLIFGDGQPLKFAVDGASVDGPGATPAKAAQPVTPGLKRTAKKAVA